MEVVSRRGGRITGPDDVYIGRPSKWGNPFTIGIDGERDKVIEAYREYAQAFTHEELKELRNKTLVCWCKPLACHGDVLVDLVKELR
ncbi:MAG: DUF4326 domain-containing protein [Proteobacteria bacterium]|nr:DUF4326 domain-containing protein [Pseudomonadota bacterium]